MPSILDLLGSRKDSANSARQRLQLVLVHDRINLPAGRMEEMKNEIIQVLSRYVEIDTANAQIEMEKGGREQRLIMNIPLHSKKEAR